MQSSKRFNVLFLYTVNPGVCFWRIYQFAQKMSELGLAHCRIFPDFNPHRMLPPNWERQLDTYIYELEAQVSWADIVVCQYISSPEGLSVVQAIMDTRPCLMEVDDYFKQVPHQSVAYDENHPGGAQDLWGTRQLIESAGVIVSTPWLAEQYRQYNQNVFCVPNCIDFDVWGQCKPIPHDMIRVGWIGGATHEGDLKLVKDAMYDLLDRHQNIEIYVVSAPPPQWPEHARLVLINKWVTIDKYPQHVVELSMDIGLAPLRDNLFNRGKSNLRALEYAACKIPAVCSWVEPYKNGLPVLIARDHESWMREVGNLIENKDYREQCGERLYQYAYQHYNLNDVARSYAEYLQRYI